MKYLEYCDDITNIRGSMERIVSKLSEAKNGTI